MRLVEIPLSHYCEKARWGLDRCGVRYTREGHTPLLHWRASFGAGGGRTVPVLVTDDAVLADSTAILRWADAQRPGTLYPGDPARRTEVDALEERFDARLGPATRRWVYFHLMPHREVLLTALARQAAPAEVRWFRRLYRPIVAAMRLGMNIGEEGARRSQARIDEAFATVGERLSDGRAWLVGDGFSAADLTFAALAALVLVPPEYDPALPGPDLFPDDAAAAVARWRETVAGRFALRLYASERRRTVG